MKTLTTNNMHKSTIFVILIVIFGLTACSDDFPKLSVGRYCGEPKNCTPPTEEVDISNNQWSSFTDEEKEEISQKSDALIQSHQQETEYETVGGYSKGWHDDMRLQAEYGAKGEHPFDLPEEWNWTGPAAYHAGIYDPDVYESYPWRIIWDYEVFKGSEKEARDKMYQVYTEAAESPPTETHPSIPEFKELEIAGNKAYAAIIPNEMIPEEWFTLMIVFKNGTGHYFSIADRVENISSEMTVVISSLK